MNLQKFNLAPFHKIDKEWALLTAGNKDKFNTMTVSWGGMGTLWNKPVVTVYVKPIRYTYEFMESNEYFTLSFYDEKYRADLVILGSKSGIDCDKVALTKLTPDFLKDGISFKEANLTIVCRKIYFQDLDVTQVPPPRGKQWCVSTILSLLKNEKYVGDLILQKTYKPDLLSDRRINNGERNRYEIKDHHIAIVNREFWNIVQTELKKRQSLADNKGRSNKVSLKYPFSNKIVCGECGSTFRRSLWHSKNNKYIV